MTKGSSSSGSPRKGRPPATKQGTRDRASRGSKSLAEEAGWPASYRLRPASRAALLAALPLRDEKTAEAALGAIESCLAEFVEFKRVGEFERYATPTGEVRRRLEALRDAADRVVSAAAELAAAAEGLDEADRDRLGLARLNQERDRFGRDGMRALREVAAELREAGSAAEWSDDVKRAAILADLARFALSELSSERSYGRGPKPNLAAEFLANQAGSVWERFTGKAPTRGRGDTPSPFESFASALFRVAGVPVKGAKLVRKLVEVWPAVRAFRGRI